MSALQSYFNDFLSNIRLPDSLREELKKAHTELREHLKSDDITKDLLVDSFLQGSYARATCIKPEKGHKADVDVIVVTNIDHEKTSATEAFKLIMPFAQKYYNDVTQQKRSIGITLEQVDVDLVITAAPSEEVKNEIISAQLSEAFTIGEISIYPSNSNGINCTFPHQLNNYFIAKNNLWRLGKICLDFSLRNLGMRSPEKEPFTTDERLFWHAKRAVMWIQCAAKNELVSPGDYFELPDYTSQHTEVFAFNEDIVSMMHWEDADVNCGIAKTQHLYSSNISCVTVPLKFTSADEKETVYIPCWANSILECKDSTIDNALWLKLSSPLVVNGWQAPMTFGELQQACVAQGIDFFMHLKAFASKVRDGKSHLVLFGFPVSKHYGEPPSEIV